MSSSRDKENLLTEFQLFTLAYLASEERKKAEKEHIIDDYSFVHHSESSVLPHPVKVTIDELANMLPPSMIPEGFSLEKAHSELEELCSLGLLNVGDHVRARFLPEHAGYYITTNGKFKINKHFAKLVDAAKNRKIYDQVIEREETSQQLKEKFKAMWPKIKDKSTDEAVSMVFSIIKQYGVIGISVLIHLISQYSKHLN